MNLIPPNAGFFIEFNPNNLFILILFKVVK